MIQLDKRVYCDGEIEGIGVHKNRGEAIKLAKKTQTLRCREAVKVNILIQNV